MEITRVRFDGSFFFLAIEQDVDDTKAAIVAAVRDGAGFVDFHTVGHGTISLLVTPTVPIRFETVTRSEEELTQFEMHPLPLESPSRDWDYYLAADDDAH
jgi:hypothetical protein